MFVDLIGEGAFCQVYHGMYQGSEVAIKQLKIPLSSQDRNYFTAEVQIKLTLYYSAVVLVLFIHVKVACTTHWIGSI